MKGGRGIAWAMLCRTAASILCSWVHRFSGTHAACGASPRWRAAFEIIDRFHDLQERLDFYEGWIGSESKYMRRSFTTLVDASKRATENDIQAAWDKRGKSGNADPSDNHPVIDPVVTETFLRDVRAHLSSRPLRWAGVAWRNRRC